MQRVFRFILGAAVMACTLACVATVALWVAGRRAPRGVQFHARGELWRAQSHRGALTIDNEPQRTAEFEAVERRFQSAVNEAYSRAREHYEQSGRDLAVGLTPQQAKAREAFEDDLRQANELRWGMEAARTELEQRWRATPVVRRTVGLALPAAFTAVPALGWVALAIVRGRRHRERLRSNRCIVCGYDLRETPLRCPECGTRAAAAAAAAGVAITSPSRVA